MTLTAYGDATDTEMVENTVYVIEFLNCDGTWRHAYYCNTADRALDCAAMVERTSPNKVRVKRVATVTTTSTVSR